MFIGQHRKLWRSIQEVLDGQETSKKVGINIKRITFSQICPFCLSYSLQCQAVMKKDEITVHNYYICKSNRCKDIDKAQNIRDLGITSTLIQPRVTVQILGYGHYVIFMGKGCAVVYAKYTIVCTNNQNQKPGMKHQMWGIDQWLHEDIFLEHRSWGFKALNSCIKRKTSCATHILLEKI